MLDNHTLEKEFPDFILGFQDGLVNVFGVVMAVAFGTKNIPITILAALAATFAESISMGGVAYTSTRAEHDLYLKKKKEEEEEYDIRPQEATQEINDSLKNMGIKPEIAKEVTKSLMGDKKSAVEFMLKNELNLSTEVKSAKKSALIVMFSAFLGSFVPISPFFFLNIDAAIVFSFLFSSVVLFLVGFYKSRIYETHPLKEGLELLMIGMGCALLGFGIGFIFGVK